tara:strand:- start:1699 stop:2901 length:1203 start_codon:yes stop_codon:yes gene_type:complete
LSKPKIKIIHLIGSLNPGGVQTYILNIANYDSSYGIHREVCTLYQSKGLLFNQFIKKNIKISFCPIMPIDRNWRPYSLWKKLRSFAGFLYFFRLYKILKTSKPDIIILDEPAKLFTQFIVPRLLNIPIIWNIHAERSLVKNKTLFKWLYKYFLKKNLAIIADSKFVLSKNLRYMKNYLKEDYEKIPIVHATVDLNKFLSINKKSEDQKTKNRTIILGSIGRLNWAKGYDLLIKALSRIKKKHPNFHLKIAGDGPYRNLLENMVKKYSLQSNVSMLGELNYNDIPNFLLSIDLYIQPSISEGSPITIKEAMASALPILASKAGGIPEIIDHNNTGLLFENGSITELEKGLTKLLNMDNSLKQKMGKRARENSMKLFNIEKTAQRLASIYNSVLNDHKSYSI